jgi:hypothetical protein
MPAVIESPSHNLAAETVAICLDWWRSFAAVEVSEAPL